MTSCYRHEEIIKELKSQNIVCQRISVMKKKDALMPIHPVKLVHLAQNTDLRELSKIQVVCLAKIKMELCKNKKGISQCHRCQNFGHGSKNCCMPPWCIKCGGNHLTKTCIKEKDEKPKCVNYEGIEYPAIYSQCPALLDYKKELDSRAKPKHSPYKDALLQQTEARKLQATQPPPSKPNEST